MGGYAKWHLPKDFCLFVARRRSLPYLVLSLSCLSPAVLQASVPNEI